MAEPYVIGQGQIEVRHANWWIDNDYKIYTKWCRLVAAHRLLWYFELFFGFQVSFVSSLIVIPVNVIIDQLFRRSVPRTTKVGQDKKGFFARIKFDGWLFKPKPKSEEKTITNSQEAPTNSPSENIKEHTPEDCETNNEESASTSTNRSEISKSSTSLKSHLSLTSSKSEVIELTQEELEQKLNENLGKTSQKAKKKTKTLPFWCAYLAWGLVLLTSTASAFFTFTYSIEWGKELANAWLTSMVMSIVESVLLIQPGKVNFVMKLYLHCHSQRL